MEEIWLAPPSSLDASFFGRPEVSHDFKCRAPSLELDLPVHQNACWYDHQVRSPIPIVGCQVCEHGYRLDGLAQTHFVSQNTIHTLLLQTDHPLHADELVVAQHSFQQIRLLGLDVYYGEGVYVPWSSKEL